ncbi:MAG: histidine ammonia-lyase [Bacteroidetes bacterium]|nr:histidine ammonia-lyase [Bacteroidota bacterium]
MSTFFEINPDKKLSINDLVRISTSQLKLKLSETAKQNILSCRKFLDEKTAKQTTPVYGINTGFGSLCNVIIPEHELEILQENLVKSHACGMGQKVAEPIIKLMLLLKVQSLSYGKSGVQLITVERLIDFYNLNIIPVVFEQGSLGASGDLAPLAHLCLPLLGLGKVYYKEKIVDAKEALDQEKLSVIKLKSKEGLALLNGTQFMSACGCYALMKAQNLFYASLHIAALSLDAFDGRIEPFKSALHLIRPHEGQIKVAELVTQILYGSNIISQAKEHVQDPYSFRCIPQVHGATYDTISYAKKVIEIEINSVTDNPTVFPEYDEILSGGNFHGQPIAMVFDFLCIAMSELASISERRIYLLISGQRTLPAFLVSKAGLNSGFMIPQYTAAGIASQNKQLCTPASADSITSSNGQEDHVSMGANAATKLLTVITNCESIYAIELLTAAQALEFRRPLQSSKKIEKLFSDFRKEIPFVNDDVVMHDIMKQALNFTTNYIFHE